MRNGDGHLPLGCSLKHEKLFQLETMIVSGKKLRKTVMIELMVQGSSLKIQFQVPSLPSQCTGQRGRARRAKRKPGGAGARWASRKLSGVDTSNRHMDEHCRRK